MILEVKIVQYFFTWNPCYGSRKNFFQINFTAIIRQIVGSHEIREENVSSSQTEQKSGNNNNKIVF